jgi:DNA-binding XRE family transcriptional regulator
MFKTEFIARTKAMRERSGLTQEQVATAIGVALDTYKKYEQRTPLPHHLVPRFAVVVRATADELFQVRSGPTRLIDRAVGENGE